MIFSAKTEGLASLRKRLGKVRALPGLDAVLRSGADLVRDQARVNLSDMGAPIEGASKIVASLEIQSVPEKDGYVVETSRVEGAELEFGSLEKPEIRWLGGALDAKRRQIGDRVRNYLRGLVK